MAEYINREELLKDIDDSVRFSTRNGVSAELRGAHKIVDCIYSAPACDVVEVVRCSECKYFGKELKQGKHSCLNYQLLYCLENDYCSYGKRLEADGDKNG